MLTYADVLAFNSPLKSIEKSKLLVIDGLSEVLANGAKEPNWRCSKSNAGVGSFSLCLDLQINGLVKTPRMNKQSSGDF